MMKKLVFAASAALAAATLSPAANASVTLTCPGLTGQATCTFDEAGGSGTFGNTYLSATPSFTDVFLITLSDAYELSLTVTNTADVGGPISFSSVQLLTGADVLVGNLTLGAIANTFALAPDTYKLVFTGSTSAAASYGGTIDIQAVPEPATWAMMVAGIGVVGMALRRRSRTAHVAFS